MNFEPQKFFIGMIEFFSIILPGALLAYLWKDRIAWAVLGRPTLPLDGAENLTIFLFLSYLLGHIVFLIGSWLLDNLYDEVRGCTYFGRIKKLAKGENSPGYLLRKLSGWLFKGGADAALISAIRIKSRALSVVQSEDAINAFQWCKLRLSKEHPEGLTTVQRFEADSKFFRSFSVVLIILAGTLFAQQRPGVGLGCVALLFLALWRFADQRFKSTEQAYWFGIMLQSLQPAAKIPYRPQLDHTHAGGVVFREKQGGIEYLLVRSNNPQVEEWVLPKGHIEWGETDREAAVREVHEETGCWAQAGRWLGDVTLRGADGTKVRFFLMKFVREDSTLLEDRTHEWLSASIAMTRTQFEEVRGLLERAEKALPQWDQKYVPKSDQ